MIDVHRRPMIKELFLLSRKELQMSNTAYRLFGVTTSIHPFLITDIAEMFSVSHKDVERKYETYATSPESFWWLFGNEYNYIDPSDESLEDLYRY